MSSIEEDHRGVRGSGPFGELLFWSGKGTGGRSPCLDGSSPNENGRWTRSALEFYAAITRSINRDIGTIHGGAHFCAITKECDETW